MSTQTEQGLYPGKYSKYKTVSGMIPETVLYADFIQDLIQHNNRNERNSLYFFR
jgi:hypothetical protein